MEPALTVITPYRDGPLVVRGPVRLVDQDGQVIDVDAGRIPEVAAEIAEVTRKPAPVTIWPLPYEPLSVVVVATAVDDGVAGIAGQRLPDPSIWDTRVTSRLHLIPAWGDYSLRQLSDGCLAIT